MGFNSGFKGLINLFPFINQLHSRPTYTIVYRIITPTYFGTAALALGIFTPSFRTS